MTPRTARMRRKRRRCRGGRVLGQSMDSGIAPPLFYQHFCYQSSKRRYCTVLEEDDCVAVPSVGPVGHHQIVGELSTIPGCMVALSQAKNDRDRLVCANVRGLRPTVYATENHECRHIALPVQFT